MQLSKKEAKRLYDIEYRRKNKERLKKQKQDWFKATYNPELASIKRKEKMPRHIEYCRQPKYKKYKKQYDQQYLAKKKAGEFWESWIIIDKIGQEVCKQVPEQYERLKMRGHIQRYMFRKSIQRNLLYGWKIKWSTL